MLVMRSMHYAVYVYRTMVFPNRNLNVWFRLWHLTLYLLKFFVTLYISRYFVFYSYSLNDIRNLKILCIKVYYFRHQHLPITRSNVNCRRNILLVKSAEKNKHELENLYLMLKKYKGPKRYACI